MPCLVSVSNNIEVYTASAVKKSLWISTSPCFFPFFRKPHVGQNLGKFGCMTVLIEEITAIYFNHNLQQRNYDAWFSR
jgi:hypothetical protein